jgi:predicted RNase H-like nuclease
METLFVGVDLAWSVRNPSGVVLLRLGGSVLRVKDWLWERDLKNLLDLLSQWKDGVLIAVDAPLIVPNLNSRRPVDATISKMFRKEEAGCLPANRRILRGLNGPTWPERFLNLLEKVNVRHDPFIKKGDTGRKVFEIFPHPAQVRLFALKKTLKYKMRKGRDKKSRESELKGYLLYLKGLEEAEPPLKMGRKFIEEIKEAPLKKREDLLDALFSAYLSAWFYHHGPSGYEMIGDMETGYILLPKRVTP